MHHHSVPLCLLCPALQATAVTACPQFAGVVTSLGPEETNDTGDRQTPPASSVHTPTSIADLHIGDRVLGACRFGSYATHLNISAQQVLFLQAFEAFETSVCNLVGVCVLEPQARCVAVFGV